MSYSYSTSGFPSTYYTTSSQAVSGAPAEGIATVIATLAGVSIVVWLILVAIGILQVVARWKVFKKANVPGYESLIPVHSDIVEMQLGGISTGWWFLNLLAVCCGIGPIILHFWRSIAISKAFGKGTGFGVLMGFFPYVCYPILAFGSAQYVGVQKTEQQ